MPFSRLDLWRNWPTTLDKEQRDYLKRFRYTVLPMKRKQILYRIGMNPNAYKALQSPCYVTYLWPSISDQTPETFKELLSQKYTDNRLYDLLITGSDFNIEKILRTMLEVQFRYNYMLDSSDKKVLEKYIPLYREELQFREKNTSESESAWSQLIRSIKPLLYGKERYMESPQNQTRSQERDKTLNPVVNQVRYIVEFLSEKGIEFFEKGTYQELEKLKNLIYELLPHLPRNNEITTEDILYLGKSYDFLVDRMIQRNLEAIIRGASMENTPPNIKTLLRTPPISIMPLGL